MATERTLSIIKPDGVAKNVIGEIYSRFEKAGLRIVAARMVHLSKEQAQAFYAVHKERPFYNDLVKFMTSGPVMVQVLEGDNAVAKHRDIMGATNPKNAAPGTIRADFADSVEENAVHDSDATTNRSKALRTRLQDSAEIRLPEVVTEQASRDGTRKWLIKVDGGNSVETVFIPEDDRGTLCVSSQVGCTLNCSFCSTAQQGFNRNLSTAEIIGQLFVAYRALGDTPKGERRISNVVMMGMGEPLLNFDNVVRAMNIMIDDFAYGLSKRRVTLSTAGVVPGIAALREACHVSLAVSLPAPADALRNQLVPLNKKYNIAELMAACRRYLDGVPHRKLTFEYVMLEGVNDSPKHAHELVMVFEGFLV